MAINVLVACEESQTVCKAFRALGHNAFSCDLVPCSGGHPEWHLQCCFTNKVSSSSKRSKTFQGIANAMAEQWSYYIENYG